MENQDYYQILGIRMEASPAEIKKAYHQLAREYHPDKVSGLGKDFQELAARKMEAINEAYSVLSDPEQKSRYDNRAQSGNNMEKPQQRRKETSRRERQQEKQASKDNHIREQSRAEMMMETSMFRVRDSIKQEVNLPWQMDHNSSFAISMSAKTMTKRYYVYFKTFITLTPNDFTTLMQTLRSMESSTKSGLTGKESMCIVAFQNMQQGVKVEELWKQFNQESLSSGKHRKYITMINTSTGKTFPPTVKIKDKKMAQVALKTGLNR